MSRRITKLRFGQEVKYFNEPMLVLDVYPYIAYLKSTVNDEIICVNIGDLVMAGLEPSTPDIQLVYSGN